jgi:hypothetical protein
MGRKTYDPGNGRHRPGGYQHDYSQVLAELHAQRHTTRTTPTTQTSGDKRRRTEERR